MGCRVREGTELWGRILASDIVMLLSGGRARPGVRGVGCGADGGAAVGEPAHDARVVLGAVRVGGVLEDGLLVAGRLGEPRVGADRLEALLPEVGAQGVEHLAGEP